MVLNDCGKCRYTVSGEEIDLEFGDILVIMPWVLHSFRLTDENDYFLAATYLISLEMIANHNFDVCSSKYCLPILARKCNDYCVIRHNSEHYDEFKPIALQLFDTFFDHDNGLFDYFCVRCPCPHYFFGGFHSCCGNDHHASRAYHTVGFVRRAF